MALPHGTEWCVSFPPRPVIFWVWKEKSKAGSLSKEKRGENVFIYPAPELFIKAYSVQQPAGAPDLLACATSIYILFITSSTLQRALDPSQPEQMCLEQDLYPPCWVWDIFHAGIPFMGVFGDWANCVLFIKTCIQCGLTGLAGWWNFLLCLLLCIEIFLGWVYV